MGIDANEARDRNASRRNRRRQSQPADWTSVSADAIRSAIVAASNAGGALRFGYTSDGGAYAVGIYGDGEPYTEFYTPSEDLDAALLDIMQSFIDLQDDIATSGAQKNGPEPRKKGPGRK